MEDCPHRGPRQSSGLHLCALLGGGGAYSCETCAAVHWVDGRPPARLGLSPPTIERPGLLAQFKSALTAFRRYVADGGRLLDPDAKAARLAVCSGCSDRRTRLRRFDQCQACGCVLTFKAAIPAEACPRGLWPGDPPPGTTPQPCGGCG